LIKGKTLDSDLLFDKGLRAPIKIYIYELQTPISVGHCRKNERGRGKIEGVLDRLFDHFCTKKLCFLLTKVLFFGDFDVFF
jgi:hypothetical protein